ncbi:MAG TPA: pseudouridine synthase [Clostridiales bacterium]|nr:pseudouridine synthase [Clostridiales bacterium]
MEERLQKLLAAAGIASRRKAEEMIAAGRVSLNGKVVQEPGTKADLGKDKIAVDGQLVQRKERKIYVLLNKPKGYVCTVNDTHGRPTVLDLLPDWHVRIYPVGRLDLDTSGLLLLTNDGSFTNKIIHPAKEINKIYRAEVQGTPSEEQLNLLRKGLVLEEETFAPAKIRLLAKKGRDTVWEVIIHEGKKRQIRRMFKEIKHPVLSLTRTNIDFLSCKGLKEGEWRFLKKEEIRRLLGDVKEAPPKEKVIVVPKARPRGNKYPFYGKRVSR